MKGMIDLKKISSRFFLPLAIILFALLLVSCADDNTVENDETEEKAEDLSEDQNNEEDDLTSEEEIDQAATIDDSEKDSNESSSNDKSDNPLANYSTQEIEYARVWLNFGPNQDVEEIYVNYIPAGTLLNPDEDDINVSYPVDVIQIRGSRIVDGLITYSGNGDGTINIYNIPYRWYGGNPRPDEFEIEEIFADRNDIINKTELVYIEPGDDQAVIELIEKMTIVD